MCKAQPSFPCSRSAKRCDSRSCTTGILDGVRHTRVSPPAQQFRKGQSQLLAMHIPRWLQRQLDARARCARVGQGGGVGDPLCAERNPCASGAPHGLIASERHSRRRSLKHRLEEPTRPDCPNWWREVRAMPWACLGGQDCKRRGQTQQVGCLRCALRVSVYQFRFHHLSGPAPLMCCSGATHLPLVCRSHAAPTRLACSRAATVPAARRSRVARVPLTHRLRIARMLFMCCSYSARSPLTCRSHKHTLAARAPRMCRCQHTHRNRPDRYSHKSAAHNIPMGRSVGGRSRGGHPRPVRSSSNQNLRTRIRATHLAALSLGAFSDRADLKGSDPVGPKLGTFDLVAKRREPEPWKGERSTRWCNSATTLFPFAHAERRPLVLRHPARCAARFAPCANSQGIRCTHAGAAATTAV